MIFVNFKPSRKYLKKCKGKRRMQQRIVLTPKEEAHYLWFYSSCHFVPHIKRSDHDGGALLLPGECNYYWDD